MPKVTLLKCLKTHMTWTTSSEQRLLTFLCMFPDEFVPLPRDSGFVSRRFNNRGAVTDYLATRTTTARAAIQKHGTPVRLLELFYRKMGVRLIIFQGATCRYVHIPDDWNERTSSNKITVVLNIWNNHVFTYKRDVHDVFFMAKNPKHHERQLLSLHKDDDDKSQYEDMVPFEWPALMEAVQEKESTLFWATASLGAEFFRASMI